MTAATFSAELSIEPMSGSKGKRKYLRKGQIVEAVLAEKPNEIVEARRTFAGKKLSLSIDFFLVRGMAGQTNTTGKKDIDNLLKPVFDALQAKVDAQGRMNGLGLIEDDDLVYQVRATKHIVDSKSEVGIKLVLAEFVAEC